MQEAELAMLKRRGASEEELLDAQSSLACTYSQLGQLEESLSIERDVYSARLKLNGEEHGDTLVSANNYAASLLQLQRFEEVKALMRKTLPVARRVLGECGEHTLRMPWIYARALYHDPTATLDDLREAVTMLEDTASTARRVLGGAHPFISTIDPTLAMARAALRNRETPGGA